MEFDLSSEEIRVLGALIEKEHTTPDYYPLTMNALINACNQKSNREPVVDYNEDIVGHALDRLRDRNLAYRVQLSDSRVPKYEANMDKQLGLTLQEVAVLAVLMLRGAQTVGELRGRTARIYPFEDLGEVNITLQTLMEQERPMVTRLPVQAGRKEARYAHLLSGEPDPEMLEFSSSSSHTSHPDPGQVESLTGEMHELKEQVAELKRELDQTRAELATFKQSFAIFRAQFE